MLRRRSATDPRDVGAAVVELALVVPIFVMLFVGIVQFGRAYNQQIQLQASAAEGARALSLKRTSAEVAAAVTAVAPGASVGSSSGCATSGATATVTVTKSFTFGIPFVPVFTKTLTATGARRCP